MNDTDRADVAIYEKATRKIVSMIGKDMRRHDGTGSGRHTAELRLQTGRERVNDSYDAAMLPAGKYAEGDTIELSDLE